MCSALPTYRAFRATDSADVRFTESPDGGETLGAEIGKHVFDAPESVRSRFAPKSHGLGGAVKMGLDVPRHESPFFRFQVCLGERRAVHMRPCQGDPCRLFVQIELLWVDPVDCIEVVVEAPGLVRRLAEHVREVDPVQRQHFADDIEHPIP